MFASLGLEGNKISWRNDLVQGLIIDRFFNTLTPTFEAVVLTPGHEPSSRDGSAATGKNMWCRVRPIQTSDLMLPDPFRMTVAKHLRKVINQHPVGWLKQSPDGSLQPQVGEIWQCRYTTSNKMGIEIVKKLRGSKRNYMAPETEGSTTPVDMGDATATVGDYTEDSLKNPADVYDWPSPKFWKPVWVDGKKTSVQKGGNKYRTDKVEFEYYTGDNTTWKNKKVYNGNIPPDLLTTTDYKVDPNRSGWPSSVTILTEALPYYISFADAYVAYFGQLVPINASYRTYAGQVRMRDKYGAGMAAYPGTSNHGWGLALDIQPHMKDPYAPMPRNGIRKYNNKPPPWTVPSERTSGKYKYPMKAGKAGTNDWYWRGAGFYSDFYIWANVDGNATNHRWENPAILRDGKNAEETWHYDFMDKDKYISESASAEEPGEEGGGDG